jgi:ribosomal protein L35
MHTATETNVASSANGRMFDRVEGLDLLDSPDSLLCREVLLFPSCCSARSKRKTNGRIKATRAGHHHGDTKRRHWDLVARRADESSDAELVHERSANGSLQVMYRFPWLSTLAIVNSIEI